MPGKRMRNVSVASSTSNSISDDESNDYGLGESAGSSNGSSDGSKIIAPRKGRRPSSRPCPSHNAAVARANRQKKKEYLDKLENNLSNSENKNRKLNNVVAQQKIDIKRLTAEVSYLKNILNNNSSITSLLKSMNQALGKNNNNNNNIIMNNNNIESEQTPAPFIEAKGISDPSDTDLSPLEGDDMIYPTESMDIGFEDNDFDKLLAPSCNNQGSLLEATNLFDNLNSTDLCWVWLDRIRT
ncbi:probable basic-leucine zipper transcription factor E isoform X2 [Aphidius gifuensis]|uniref:probable basic-leucine zipper transcription factor E isoform X2 n=1 Tax=Aphidius gifuensis TaxID=684658 RepID=UPI001CDCC9BE|nr:probable basic-leucine zipper transcription factor E isoform X2 [Aphidius gifuensis]